MGLNQLQENAFLTLKTPVGAIFTTCYNINKFGILHIMGINIVRTTPFNTRYFLCLWTAL